MPADTVVRIAPENLKSTTLALLSYCQANHWEGYDPYDALNSRVFRVLPLLDSRVSRIALTQVLKRSPLNPRSLLQVPKTRNPKGLALALAALIKLSRLGLLENQDLIGKIADMLIALRSENTPYWCWGYSFPWQTRTILVPRGAPNLVCTTFVANALLDAYERNSEPRYLAMATSAAEYLLNELYWNGENPVACFAYPLPTSRTRVHNANFLGAALLCRVYKLTGEKKYLEPAIRVARYSAGKQHDNGSWDYGELSTQSWVDNFHTGYNLCALQSISKNAELSEFQTNIQSGFEFYRDQFFRDDSAPKYFHDRTYPIDIHSVAQSIITLAEFSDFSGENVGRAINVFEWAMQHMWDRQGYFYFQVLPWFLNRISYMRWSQAWMLLAMSTLLEQCDQVG